MNGEGLCLMEQEIRDMLEKPFSDDLVQQRTMQGKKVDYVSIHAIEQRLNDALGQDGWDFQLDQFIQTAEEVIQFGRLGIPGKDGQWRWKADVGCQQVIYKKNAPHEPGNEVSLGNNMKMAVSDCLKRCAKHLGVALDLYGEVEEGGESSGANGNKDPREVVLENITNGEMSLSKKLECSYTDLRNQHFGPDNDNLESKSLEELEDYLVFLRGLRDEGEKDKAQPPDKEQPESGANDTNGAPGDVIKLKNEASQAQTKALRDGVIKKLDADALRMKHFDSRNFPDDAAKLRAFIREISAL